MYKWFLAARYLRTKLIAWFGVASVMLCSAMVLVVVSVMGGFLDTVRERARGLHSEVILEGGTLQGFPFYDEFGKQLQIDLPDLVARTTPAIYSYGIFREPRTTWTKPTRVVGVRLEDYVQVNKFHEGLHYDRYFPGTTTLGMQRLPIVGTDPATGRYKFPESWEQANARWRAAEGDQDAVAAFDAQPFQPAPVDLLTTATVGDRVFASDMGEPRFSGPELPGIIVGCDLLNERRKDGNFNRYLARGATVALTLMPLTPMGNPFGEPPIKMVLRYVDDSRTGIYEIDSLQTYVDFDILQERLAMSPQPTVGGGLTSARTNQLLVGLKKDVDINFARDEISAAWARFTARMDPLISDVDAMNLRMAKAYTWEDLQRPFISAVEKEKVLVTFLFGLISMVAIVLVGCIFYMIVEKKTRDIGILKSIGASGQGVAGLFILYATVVGFVGSALGVLLGSEVVWHINDIQDWLANLNPQLRVWSPEIYSFDKIPNVVKTADAVGVAVVAVVASVIGSIIPAWIAGRVWPVAALRYE